MNLSENNLKSRKFQLGPFKVTREKQAAVVKYPQKTARQDINCNAFLNCGGTVRSHGLPWIQHRLIVAGGQLGVKRYISPYPKERQVNCAKLNWLGAGVCVFRMWQAPPTIPHPPRPGSHFTLLQSAPPCPQSSPSHPPPQSCLACTVLAGIEMDLVLLS